MSSQCVRSIYSARIEKESFFEREAFLLAAQSISRGWNSGLAACYDCQNPARTIVKPTIRYAVPGTTRDYSYATLNLWTVSWW